MTWVSGLCALPFSGRTLSLSAPNEVLFGADGATGLPVDRRLLRTLVRLAACARSHFRAGLYPLNRGRAPPAPGTKRTTAGPAGGGRMADQLWGRVGSSGLASARVWVTGVCALPFSRRTLSIESRPRAAGAWGKKNNRRPGGRWRRGRPARGSRRRERARERARRELS